MRQPLCVTHLFVYSALSTVYWSVIKFQCRTTFARAVLTCRGHDKQSSFSEICFTYYSGEHCAVTRLQGTIFVNSEYTTLLHSLLPLLILLIDLFNLPVVNTFPWCFRRQVIIMVLQWAKQNESHMQVRAHRYIILTIYILKHRHSYQNLMMHDRII